MNGKTFTLIFTVLLSAALAIHDKNWIWVIVSALCTVLLLSPRIITGNRDASYCVKILIITMIPFLLFSVITGVMLVGDFITQYYLYAVLSLQTLAAMMCGYMLFVTLHERTELKLSKKWVLVFSLLFACSVSVLYMFALFQAMVNAGHPMYNADFEGPHGSDNTESNTVLMMPAIITVFASIIYAVIIRAYLRNVTDDELCFYTGGVK